MNSAASENEKPKTSAPETDSGERLQKLMAKAGLGSRRACEALIEGGRVSINGHIITELGTRADLSSDRVVVDGKPLTLPSGPAVVVMLHKPRGVMTTRNDPENRPTVMGLLPRKWENLHPVGRLDFDTSGLLLLTDDGELTQLLTHPSHGVEKTYQARVRGTVKSPTVRLLQDGVRLEDGVSGPCRVRVRAQTQNNALVEITLREGRNRQVRRMLEAVGHQVSSLRRTKFGPIEIEGVALGTYRQLLAGEVHMLRKAANSKSKLAKAKNQAPRARKLSPASPISAEERARRKEVVRAAKAVRSNLRAAAYRARKQSDETPDEIIAPTYETPQDARPISRGPAARPASNRGTGRPASARPISNRPTSERSTSSRTTSPRPASSRTTSARPDSNRPDSNRPDLGRSTSGYATSERSNSSRTTSARPASGRTTLGRPDSDRTTSGRPDSGHSISNRPNSTRSTSARPSSSRPTSGRPISSRTTPARPAPARPAPERPNSERSTRPTSSGASPVRGRDAQTRDDRGRDGRGRDAKPRDDRGLDAKPRDGRGRDAKSYGERSAAPANRPNRAPAGQNPRGRNSSSAPEAPGEGARNRGEKSAVAKRIQKRWQ